MLVSQEKFLSELGELFSKTRETGSVSLTMKRMTSKKEEEEPRCLVRARTEKKRISTLVDSKQVLKFQASLCALTKANMTSLKRKERQKKDKKT